MPSLVRDLAQLQEEVRARHQLSDGRGHEDELTLHDGCPLTLRLHEKLEVDETRFNHLDTLAGILKVRAPPGGDSLEAVF